MGDLEFSCGGLGRAAMTALTDQGLGFGREDVCDMALAAAKAVMEEPLASGGQHRQQSKMSTWYCAVPHLAGRMDVIHVTRKLGTL